MEAAAGGAGQQRQNKASAGKKSKKGGGSGGTWPAVKPKKDLQINRLKGIHLLTVSASSILQLELAVKRVTSNH